MQPPAGGLKNFVIRRLGNQPHKIQSASTTAPGSRVLFRNEEAGFVQPSSWTPDGKQILTLFFRKDNISQIALVDAENGAVLRWRQSRPRDMRPLYRWVA